MHDSTEEIFGAFLEAGTIAAVGPVIKSGKEAEVWLCEPGDGLAARAAESGVEPPRAIALKVYKDVEERSFRNMAGYLDGRIGRSIRGRRDILHMYSDPASMQAFWVEAEWEALARLSRGGLPVPRPWQRTGKALAMDLVEEEGEVAPQLVKAGLPRELAPGHYDGLVETLLEMLRLDLIHGDLSPYNILVRDGRLVIIDFPQAIDARYHSQAEEMFRRDLGNVSRWFERAGVAKARDADCIAARAWELYERNRL